MSVTNNGQTKNTKVRCTGRKTVEENPFLSFLELFYSCFKPYGFYTERTFRNESV